MDDPRGRRIGTASFLADVGHEIPTALMASLVTGTLGAPASALGLIEGISDGLAGAGPFLGGPLADDPGRRRRLAVGGYTVTAILSSLIGTAGNVVTAGLLRGGAWAARGLRVPARNALLADVVPATAYGRAYGFERTMDNLGAIVGPLLALGLVAVVSVRTAILISVVPGLIRWQIAESFGVIEVGSWVSSKSIVPVDRARLRLVSERVLLRGVKWPHVLCRRGSGCCPLLSVQIAT